MSLLARSVSSARGVESLLGVVEWHELLRVPMLQRNSTPSSAGRLDTPPATKLGRDDEPPQWCWIDRAFLTGAACVYIAAFLSYASQVHGLYGCVAADFRMPDCSPPLQLPPLS